MPHTRGERDEDNLDSATATPETYSSVRGIWKFASVSRSLLLSALNLATSLTLSRVQPHSLAGMMSSLRPLAASSRSILRSPSLARPLARAASFLTSPAPPEPAAEDRPDASTPKLYQQSPNHPKTWSLHQNPKPHAYDNARFEQVDLAFQPNPKSAMAMVAEDPIRLVNGRKAACDGGE